MAERETTEPTICPGCGSKMRQHTIGGIEIDRCEHCGGVWLDMLERDKLLAAGKAELAEGAGKYEHAPSDRVRTCPRDHARLIQLAALGQPHIKFQSCKTCGGSFFDAGELKDLSHHTLLERLKSWLTRF